MLAATVTHADEAGRAAFRTHLKPYLSKLLTAIGLDIVYSRGEGDYLFYQDEAGRERQVLDVLGGYGVALFGHNHPQLLQAAQQIFSSRRPFVAQASARSYAGLLAQRLSGLVQKVTGRTYMVTLANSGTEAVEAAIKHAELERALRIQDFSDDLRRTFKLIRIGLNQGTIQLPAALFDEAAQRLHLPRIADLDALEFYLLQHNGQALQVPGHYLAVKGAFHGKTTGSLKLTHNPDFRNPWYGVGIQAHFIPRNDLDAINRELKEAEITCYDLVLDGRGRVRLEERRWSRIVACLVEPIQGEGGIHELAAPFLAELRGAADEHRFALVMDEIQSGMGRTGDFLASQAAGVEGDYYLFSKALGGGLAKISALLVRSDRYVEEFGYLHTSTFADDDFSAAVGLAALDLLEQDGGALMTMCREKGDYLLGKLRTLQAQYPGVFKDVRGRGLLIGLELLPQHTSASRLLAVATEQNLLCLLLCGYLLHEQQIRVTPTLSASNTIRIEPSAYISYAELDRLCLALAEAAELIANADAHRFVRYLTGRTGTGDAARGARPQPRAQDTPGASFPVPLRKVGCIAHFINPEDLLHWDPSLAPLTREECTRLLERTDPILKPFVVDEKIVRSPSGEQIHLTVIGVALTSAQIVEKIHNGQVASVVTVIEEAVEEAKRLGCTLIGFAGYTSIATNNCQALVEYNVGLTSGNSLTALAAIEATHEAARQQGIVLAEARLGVVGGVGNIGRVLTEVKADTVASITLVGRPGSERRLVKLAETLYARAWQQIVAGNAQSGIARALAAADLAGRLSPEQGSKEIGAAIRDAFAADPGLRAPVQVTTDLAELRHCNLIITASSSPEPIIYPEHLGAGPTVICDVSVPSDVHSSVLAHCPQVKVVKGGVMRLPLGQDLSIPGMALDEGQAYACLSEVVLLGLAGMREHFSYGALLAERVRQIGHLARQHGFSVIVQSARERVL
jgi:acetylornithine/succinyldiaminopimelate/putrescine aminotransferase/predicted amino acid dehydrogenase